MSDTEAVVVRPRIHSADKKPLQDLLPLRTPISAHVDISSICNYRCSFCFQADTKGMKEVGLKRGWMEVDMFKKIVIGKLILLLSKIFYFLMILFSSNFFILFQQCVLDNLTLLEKMHLRFSWRNFIKNGLDKFFYWDWDLILA